MSALGDLDAAVEVRHLSGASLVLLVDSGVGDSMDVAGLRSLTSAPRESLLIVPRLASQLSRANASPLSCVALLKCIKCTNERLILAAL